jgi:UDPglucose 6-dehydrogenase
MRITMIGSGYVGLVSGACFADFGHVVTCVDKDEGKIEMLRAGRMPIFEEGLEELVRRNFVRGLLHFTTYISKAVKEADIVFIAVGTPSRRGDGHADLTYVFDAAREIAEHLDGYTVICTKSTVPVGTGDEVARIVRETRPGAAFAVVSNPEFLREGSAIGDFKRPDRVVIGTDDPRAAAVMQQAYRPLSLNKTPIIQMSRRGAELTKYAANAFLATKITFINEVADLCEKVGADVQDVARGIGLDNRIGSKFLHAGPGYGGSCFPKDTLALLRTSEQFGAPQRIVEAVVAVNDERKRSMADRILRAMGGNAQGRTIALLGLTFKPNTDDMRDSPSIEIVQSLQESGVTVRACDPEGIEQARPMMRGVDFFDDPYDAIRGADAAVLVTEWDVYRALDLQRVAELLSKPIFVDLRNVYTPEEMERAGLTYTGIGRPPAGAKSAADRKGRIAVAAE